MDKYHACLVTVRHSVGAGALHGVPDGVCGGCAGAEEGVVLGTDGEIGALRAGGVEVGMAVPEPEGAHGFWGMGEVPAIGAAGLVASTWAARLAVPAALGGVQAFEIEFSSHGGLLARFRGRFEPGVSLTEPILLSFRLFSVGRTLTTRSESQIVAPECNKTR